MGCGPDELWSWWVVVLVGSGSGELWSCWVVVLVGSGPGGYMQ